MNISETGTYDPMKITGRGMIPLSFMDNSTDRETPLTTGISPNDSSWITFIYPIGRDKSTSQVSETMISTEQHIGLILRTAFGRTLSTLRKRAIDAGMRLLGEEEILEEVKRRRGELKGNEADLY